MVVDRQYEYLDYEYLEWNMFSSWVYFKLDGIYNKDLLNCVQKTVQS